MTSRAPDAQPEPVPGAPIPRRAPFSENPVVGARGLRTQQRILEGALRAFAEVGYEATTVERIAQDAECSRVDFYQYFRGKDGVFRPLAGEVPQHGKGSRSERGGQE